MWKERWKLEEYYKELLNIEDTRIEMKNTGFISKLDTDMERKSEFQNITQETVQS